MCARLLACPLCSQPSFPTLDALRAGLISVATRPLMCPVCNEVLLGIDKLTIHLFSHTINLNNNLLEPAKQLTTTVSTGNGVNACNLQCNTFQDWSTRKVQSAESYRITNSTGTVSHEAESSKSLQADSDKNSTVNARISVEQEITATKNTPHIVFLAEETGEAGRISILHECYNNGKVIIEPCKSSQDLFTQNLKVNSDALYSNDNVKPTDVLQPQNQLKQTKVQTLSKWIQDQQSQQYSLQNNMITMDKDETSSITVNAIAESCHNLQDSGGTESMIRKESKSANSDTSRTSMMTASSTISLSTNNEENAGCNAGCNAVDERNESEGSAENQVDVLKTPTMKVKSERCNICGFHFPDYNILLLHKQLVHMMNEKETNAIPEEILKNYSCHLCSKVFKMRGSLMVHMRVAHSGYSLGTLSKTGQEEVVANESGYSCPTCGKKFKKEQHVVQHLKTHDGKQWECDVCSKMFTTKYFLKKHKRLHSGEMPYKCNICNKTFTFQQSYHKHRLYHKDDKPHTCTTCGRSFKELSTLHNHERIHTGEKPFACETCGKCFRQRVSYLVHRRIHTGVMPYKCTVCGKSFRYKVSQRTHKCPMQQGSNTQQSSNPSLSLIQSQSPSSQSDQQNTQETSSENKNMVNLTDNEKNKYVLIINTQGQHLLAQETELGTVQSSASAATNKEENPEYIRISNKPKECKSTWGSNIPINTVFTEIQEVSGRVFNDSKKADENVNDFFTMVISPLQNEIASPTNGMQHLHVSSPMQKESILESYNNFKQNPDNVGLEMNDLSLHENYNTANDNSNTLETINEESLKELLYGIADK